MVVSNIFDFHPYLGKISNLTNIFRLSWNHQPLICWYFPGVFRRYYSYSDPILEPPCPRSGPKRRPHFSPRNLWLFNFKSKEFRALEPEKKHLFSPNYCDSTWKNMWFQIFAQKICDSKSLHKKCDSKSLPPKNGCFHHLHQFFLNRWISASKRLSATSGSARLDVEVLTSALMAYEASYS